MAAGMNSLSLCNADVRGLNSQISADDTNVIANPDDVIGVKQSRRGNNVASRFTDLSGQKEINFFKTEFVSRCTIGE